MLASMMVTYAGNAIIKEDVEEYKIPRLIDNIHLRPELQGLELTGINICIRRCKKISVKRVEMRCKG